MTITLKGFAFFCWICFLLVCGVGLIFSGTYLHSLPYKDDQWIQNGLRIIHLIASFADLVALFVSTMWRYHP